MMAKIPPAVVPVQADVSVPYTDEQGLRLAALRDAREILASRPGVLTPGGIPSERSVLDVITLAGWILDGMVTITADDADWPEPAGDAEDDLSDGYVVLPETQGRPCLNGTVDLADDLDEALALRAKADALDPHAAYGIYEVRRILAPINGAADPEPAARPGIAEATVDLPEEETTR